MNLYCIKCLRFIKINNIKMNLYCIKCLRFKKNNKKLVIEEMKEISNLLRKVYSYCKIMLSYGLKCRKSTKYKTKKL